MDNLSAPAYVPAGRLPALRSSRLTQSWVGIRQDRLGLLCTKSHQGGADLGVFVAQACGGEQRRVGGARLADGQSTDWDAAGHLRDREQRVQAFEGFGFDGYTEHRQA